MNGVVAEEVVIEAVLDHRTDGDLRARIKRLHRLGQHMRGVVADKFQRARIIAVDEFDFGVASIGSARSASAPSSAMATVRLASEGEMHLAMSLPRMPAGNWRAAPSGKVREIIDLSFRSLAETNRRKP